MWRTKQLIWRQPCILNQLCLSDEVNFHSNGSVNKNNSINMRISTLFVDDPIKSIQKYGIFAYIL